MSESQQSGAFNDGSDTAATGDEVDYSHRKTNGLSQNDDAVSTSSRDQNEDKTSLQTEAELTKVVKTDTEDVIDLDTARKLLEDFKTLTLKRSPRTDAEVEQSSDLPIYAAVGKNRNSIAVVSTSTVTSSGSTVITVTANSTATAEPADQQLYATVDRSKRVQENATVSTDALGVSLPSDDRSSTDQLTNKKTALQSFENLTKKSAQSSNQYESLRVSAHQHSQDAPQNGNTIQFLVKYLGSLDMSKADLEPTRRTSAILECMMQLSGTGAKKKNNAEPIFKWPTDVDISMELNGNSVHLMDDRNGEVLHKQRLRYVRLWGTGQEMDSPYFAYVSCDESADSHYSCHVFRCCQSGIYAAHIASAFRDVCQKRAALRNSSDQLLG